MTLMIYLRTILITFKHKIMFNRKKIQELQRRVDVLEEKVQALTDAIAEKGELDYLKVKMRDLIAFDNVISLDNDWFDFFLQRKAEDEQELYRNCKANYEKRLAKFIRSVVNKKKPNIKSLTNGKENPKATE